MSEPTPTLADFKRAYKAARQRGLQRDEGHTEDSYRDLGEAEEIYHNAIEIYGTKAWEEFDG